MEYNMMQQSDDDLDGLNNNGNSGYNSNDSANGSSSRMSNDNSGMSKAELRKSNKPIMEKRRRARINHCLNELKTLILEAMKKDPSRHTKLEKADILEMTVKHLQSIQRQQLSMAIQTDPTVIHKFKTGFVECADEVNRYVSQLDNVDAGVRQRLSNHLNNCATGLDQIGTFSNFSSSYRAANSVFGSPITNQTATMFPGATLPHHDVNNNNNNNNNTANRVQMGGVQLIPQRLPSGELALIMPNINTAASVPFFLPTMQTIQTMPPAHQNVDFSTMFPRASAFSKPVSQCANPLIRPNATKNSRTSNASPPLSPVSSASSLGDDSSLMHTSSDFQSKTPPLNIDQSFSSGEFPTPPSAESTTYVKQTSSHLQQQQVTSTSEYRQQMPNKLSTSPTVLLKRSLPDHFSDSSDEPSAKKFFGCESGDDNNGNSSTWRPW